MKTEQASTEAYSCYYGSYGENLHHKDVAQDNPISASATLLCAKFVKDLCAHTSSSEEPIDVVRNFCALSSRAESCANVMRELYANSNNSVANSSVTVDTGKDLSSNVSLHCVKVLENWYHINSSRPLSQSGTGLASLPNAEVASPSLSAEGVTVAGPLKYPAAVKTESVEHTCSSEPVLQTSKTENTDSMGEAEVLPSACAGPMCDPHQVCVKQEPFDPRSETDKGNVQETSVLCPSRFLECTEERFEQEKLDTVRFDLSNGSKGECLEAEDLQPSSEPASLNSANGHLPSEPLLVSMTTDSAAQVQIRNVGGVEVSEAPGLRPVSCFQRAEITNHIPFPVQLIASRDISPREARQMIKIITPGHTGCADVTDETDDVMPSEIADEQPRKGPQMKRYTLNDREVAIQLAKDRSCKYAAEHLRIPLATILKWMKEYVPGFLTPRRQAHEDEREIREWVFKQRDNDQPVTKEALREYARKVVSKPEFDASDAWLKAFLKRHDLKNAVLSTCEAGSGKRVSRGNYQRYTLEQRKEAVQMTASRTNTQASGQLQIPTSTINGWKRRYRSGFVDVKGNTGKTFTYDESIDYNIRDWILKKRDENTPVTRAALREYALKAVNQPRFKASEGWLRHFLRRHDLLKVVTCSSRQCTKHCNFGSHCFSETAKADGSKKPYVCKICGKGFAHPSRLKRHVAIHKS